MPTNEITVTSHTVLLLVSPVPIRLWLFSPVSPGLPSLVSSVPMYFFLLSAVLFLLAVDFPVAAGDKSDRHFPCKLEATEGASPGTGLLGLDYGEIAIS